MVSCDPAPPGHLMVIPSVISNDVTSDSFISYFIPFLPMYKSTFYSLKIGSNNHPQLIGGLQPISRATDNHAAMLPIIIAGGKTKGANWKSFVFVHQHGGYYVT